MFPGAPTPDSAADGDPDLILAVGDGPEIEEVVKHSRFLGQAFSAGTQTSARERLETVRVRYPDANHHCWAYKLGPPERALERDDDDGEPGRTAGAPILNAIVSAEVSDVLLVVTRYFGGTKLGKGGLVRAYGSTARAALEAAPRSHSYRKKILNFACDFQDLGAVEACLGRFADGVFATERGFDPAPRFQVELRASRAEGFAQALRDASAGRIKCQPNTLPEDPR